MADTSRILIPAEIDNESIRAFVEEWAGVTEPDRVELVSAADDARLIGEALAAGELLPAGEGRYYARSHPKDTARSEERTVVATSNPTDRGRYNNWQPASEVKPLITERMRGASRGRTMYVVPYLMAPPGTPLAAYAAGVELTDDRTVVLQMIRMARVGLEHFDGLSDPDFFVRGVQVTGDPDSLGHGTPEDARLFATIADERTILHYGSAYGGNALLGKIAHGLRQASYDGHTSGNFLAEQFLLLGIRDLETGATTHVCGGFPSASGKTNLAMTRRRTPATGTGSISTATISPGCGSTTRAACGRSTPRTAHSGSRKTRTTSTQTRPRWLRSRRAPARSSPTPPTTSSPATCGGRGSLRSLPRNSTGGSTGPAPRSL